jgi:hypothetical protein
VVVVATAVGAVVVAATVAAVDVVVCAVRSVPLLPHAANATSTSTSAALSFMQTGFCPLAYVRAVARYDDSLAQRLEPGESLLAAAGAIVSRRRRRSGVLPRKGFVLAVTDRRLVVFAASTWRVEPGEIIASWTKHEGARLVPAALGRARLVLPDRSVVTLAPFGGWSLRRLAAAGA